MEGLIIFAVVAGIPLYFLPSIIAVKRAHRQSGPIFALNFLLGWSLLGWAGSLAWALAAGQEEPKLPPATARRILLGLRRVRPCLWVARGWHRDLLGFKQQRRVESAHGPICRGCRRMREFVWITPRWVGDVLGPQLDGIGRRCTIG